MLKKLLKWLAICLTSLLLFVIMLVFAFAYKTEWFLNTTSVTYLIKRFAPKEHVLSWEHFEFVIHSDSIFQKHLMVRFDQLNWSQSDWESKLGPTDFLLKLNMNLRELKRENFDLQMLKVKLADGVLNLAKIPHKEKEDTPFDLFETLHPQFLLAQSLLMRADLENIDLTLKQLKIILKSEDEVAIKDYLITTSEKDKTLKLSGQVRFNSKNKIVVVHEGEFRLNLNNFNTAETWLSSHHKIAYNDNKIELPLDLVLNEKSYVLKTNIHHNLNVKADRYKIHLIINTTVASKDFLTTGSLSVSLPFNYLPEYEMKSFTLSKKGSLELDDSQPFEFETKNGLHLKLKTETKQNIKTNFEYVTPSEIVTLVDGRFWLKPFVTEPKERDKLIEFDFRFNDVNGKVFTAESFGHVLLERTFTPEKITKYVVTPKGRLKVDILQFQKLAKGLNRHWLVVPTPFIALDGEVHFFAGEEISVNDVEIKIPLKLQTRLSSSHQKVFSTHTAELVIPQPFKQQIAINFTSNIEELKLDLPPFDPLKSIPRLVPDKRFKQREVVEKKAESKFKVILNGSIETGSPAVFYYKLFKPFLPISVKAKIKNESGILGEISADNFDIEFLRRKSTVEKLSLSLNDSKDGKYPISVRLRVDQTNYKVYVEVLGTLKSPQVRLYSVPYLSQSDIVSVLLYDRPSDQLVGGDRENVGGVEAAIADKAIGLFGIWAFASTPIRSFSYNKVTKVYSANIKIDDQTTVTVGTDWDEQTNFEIRRRLSRKWVVVAIVDPEDTAQNGKIILQWENRY